MMMRPMRSVRRPASRFLLVTFLLALTACSAKRVPVVVEFSAAWDGQAMTCNDPDMALTDLRFFVADVVLIDSKGTEHDMLLTPDSRWQQGNVALIDLENGEGACLNGTPDTHARLSGSADTNDFTAIRFTVGVPFELNHANPLLAEGPLDDAAMHWHWRSGYKFLRAGVSTSSDGFWLHLGSTGCKGTVQNISECRSPNRVTVTVSDFAPESDQIVVELSELFYGIDLNDGNRGECSSGPPELACAEPFDALGLAFGDDAVGAAMPRSVFQVGR
jgi:uncharacterized repeat protein (TIGR04052 family)